MRKSTRENLRSGGYNANQICEIEEVHKRFKKVKHKISYLQAAALYETYGSNIDDAVRDHELLMRKMCRDGNRHITTDEIVTTLVETEGRGIGDLIMGGKKPEESTEEDYAYYQRALTSNM